MHARKDAVVKANTDGVAYLFKKHKIERVRARGGSAAPARSSSTPPTASGACRRST
jgi:hypothetical protein